MSAHRKYNPSLTDRERFRAKVEFTPTCWLWLGARNAAGYGLVTLKVGPKTQVSVGAYVLAFKLARGWWPRPGFVVRHLCGNPSCVRPEHLREGTHTENAHDLKLHRQGVTLVTGLEGYGL